MSVIKVLRDLNGLFNYSTDENPTSQQDYQKAVKNWVKTIVSLVDSNLWQPETEYVVGDTVRTPSLSKQALLLCITAGQSGAAEPDYTDVSSNDEITDGTVVWRVQTVTSQEKAAGFPVGFEYFSMNPNVPQGSLPLLGGEYSRTAYADLWEWVQTQNGYLLEESAWQAKATANGGNVPYYSKGDGSTTFRVPALKCWVKGANSISEVGGYLAAGLPNITGSIGGGSGSGGTAGNGSGIGFLRDTMINGCFQPSAKAYGNETGTGGGTLPSGYPVLTANLDASRSDPIYGKSTTVQPPSIVGMWVVKAYGTVTNAGSTDVANISTGLTQAETRISALENHGAAAVGSIQAFAGRTTPQGWLLCDGSAVSRTDYAALYAVIGTTYGKGNGSTTFNLPNLVDKFVEGSATAGTVKSAGLPNITGDIFGRPHAIGGNYPGAIVNASGAFVETIHADDVTNNGSEETKANSKNDKISFNASRSSSIYGNSTTVQPPALTMRYIIKY